MSQQRTESRFDRFWQQLYGLAGPQPDRGALAALRRGAGEPPGSVAEMHRYVAWALPHEQWSWENQTYYLLAALFAMHPEKASSGNLGDTFLGVFNARGKSASVEQHFTALLNCHREDLHHHLRQAVSLARSEEQAINWPQLHRDLIHWNDETGRTQREWARSFWGSSRTQS